MGPSKRNVTFHSLKHNYASFVLFIELSLGEVNFKSNSGIQYCGRRNGFLKVYKGYATQLAESDDLERRMVSESDPERMRQTKLSFETHKFGGMNSEDSPGECYEMAG